MPALVIVCGPPASGKSVLATALGREISLPVISKDLIKEAMMDQLGGTPAVGAAAFSVQFAIARQLLESGVGLILEGAFFREQTEITELASLGTTVVVSVSCELDVLEQRYVQRHPTRHPGHRGPEALPDLRRRVVNGEYGLPDLARPTLSVDTTGDISPSVSDVTQWVRHQLGEGGVRVEPDELDLRSAWEQIATAWTDWARKPDHDSYWRFGRAAFFDLLPPPGRLTLDVGCGEGRVSRDLTGLGHRVVSIDASMTMLRAAVAADRSIPAVMADGASLPVIDGCCDLVIAYMSLQDMSDLQGAITEAARALAPGGHLCMAVVHPMNSAGQFASADADADFVIRGSYLESHPYVDRVERDGMVMTFSGLHHPLEEYFRALEGAGLLVEAVREIPADEASAQDLPRRRRWRRLPLFLAIRASKPSPER